MRPPVHLLVGDGALLDVDVLAYPEDTFLIMDPYSEIGEVKEFLDHGEFGVAFETLLAILTEERRKISEPEAKLLREIAKALAFDEQMVEVVERE